MGQAVCTLPNMENRYTISALGRVASYYYGHISLLGIQIRLPNSERGVLHLKLFFVPVAIEILP